MNKEYKFNLAMFIAAISCAVIFSGCGSGGGSYKNAESSYAPEASYETGEAMADGALYDKAYDDYDAENIENTTDSEDITKEKQNSKSKRKLITNMSMNAETKEFDKTLDFIKKRTDELGGYVESFSSEKSSYNDERTANLTLRIPEEKLENFIAEVSKESNITSQDMNVTDVTLTYADLESHKNALRAEEDQLLTLMEKAESIEEIMLIQDKLTDVRYQLESMESQLRTYDNQISYSTLRLTLREVIEYTPEPVKDPTFAERAKEGFAENLAAVITFFTELALLLITHIPVLVIVFVIIIIIVIFVKIAEAKRKKRLASMPVMQPVVIPNSPVTYGPGRQMPLNGQMQQMPADNQMEANNQMPTGAQTSNEKASDSGSDTMEGNTDIVNSKNNNPDGSHNK